MTTILTSLVWAAGQSLRGLSPFPGSGEARSTRPISIRTWSPPPRPLRLLVATSRGRRFQVGRCQTCPRNVRHVSGTIRTTSPLLTRQGTLAFDVRLTRVTGLPWNRSSHWGLGAYCTYLGRHRGRGRARDIAGYGAGSCSAVSSPLVGQLNSMSQSSTRVTAPLGSVQMPVRLCHPTDRPSGKL
jgi:hypothetical protein